jgi:hypothetical protein
MRQQLGEKIKDRDGIGVGVRFEADRRQAAIPILTPPSIVF